MRAEDTTKDPRDDRVVVELALALVDELAVQQPVEVASERDQHDQQGAAADQTLGSANPQLRRPIPPSSSSDSSAV